MGRGRRKARLLAISGLALSTVLLAAGQVSAAGIFDFMFGGDRQQPAPAALPYAEPAAAPSTPSVTATPRISGGGSGGTFCVRLCDGRYFPVPHQAGITAAQTCNSLCPSAKTKVFSGSEISHARASDGARYGDLDNAFAFRKQIVAGCTCNGRDSGGLAPLDVATDPTLRPGDIVATEDGLQKFTGSQAQLRKGAGFTPVNLDEVASQRRRLATAN